MGKMDDKQQAIIDELEAIIKDLDRLIEFITAKPEEEFVKRLWDQYKKQEREILKLQKQLAKLTENDGKDIRLALSTEKDKL